MTRTHSNVTVKKVNNDPQTVYTVSMAAKSTPFASIVGELLGLGISIAVLVWLIPHLTITTPAYQLWLPIGLISTIISSVVKIIAKIIGGRIIFAAEIITLIVGMYSTYMLLHIFPVDFNRIGLNGLNDLFAFSLYIALIAMGFAIFINMIKFFTWTSHPVR